MIYTSNSLSEQLKQVPRESDPANRSYFGNLLDASLGAASGIATGYVTSFVDLGVKAIGSLIMKNSENNKKWTQMVSAENTFSKAVGTINEVNNFNSYTSDDGPMDPNGMRFDGIGCLRKVGNDTVFYISCHIDRSKLYRIVNHSKFELVLDTLVIDPAHCNLPNSQLNLPFSFKKKNWSSNFSRHKDIIIVD